MVCAISLREAVIAAWRSRIENTVAKKEHGRQRIECELGRIQDIPGPEPKPKAEPEIKKREAPTDQKTPKSKCDCIECDLEGPKGVPHISEWNLDNSGLTFDHTTQTWTNESWTLKVRIMTKKEQEKADRQEAELMRLMAARDAPPPPYSP